MTMTKSVVLNDVFYTVGRSENTSINQLYPTITLQDLDLNVYYMTLPHRGLSSIDRYETIWNVEKTTNDYLFFSGTNGELGNSGMYFFKMDANSNILWNKEIRTGTWGNQLAYGSIANDIGGALIVGTENGGSPTLEAQFVNVNSNGDTLWTRKVIASDGQNMWGGQDGVYRDQFNNFITFLRHGDGNNLEILRLNQNGNVIDNFQYIDGDGNVIYIKNAVYGENATYFCGYRGGANYESVILKTNLNGDVIWCQKYWETGVFDKIHLTQNNELIVTAKPTWGDNLNKVEVIKLDTNGNVIKGMSYGKLPEDHSLTSNILEINNHYYMSGTRQFQSNKTGYQLCLDNQLNSGTCYQSEFLVWSSPISVAKIGVTTSIISSMYSDILYYGTPASLTNYSTTSFNYEIDNTIISEIELIGDDCGGTCIGEAEISTIGGNPPYSYNWSDGQNGNLAMGLCVDAQLTVKTGDQFGCYIYDTITVPQSGPHVPICIVTVDSSSSKNVVVWEKPVSNTISGFSIYREIQGSYSLIGYVPYNNLSQFTDQTNGVNPNITSYRYKISVHDTCGYESDLSPFHETIHMTATEGLGGVINLIWDNYEGFGFSNYEILKDTTNNGIDDFYVTDNVSSVSFTWTDSTPQDYVNYAINVIPPSTCTSTKAIDHNSSRSNKSTESINNINNINELSSTDFSIYPNPNTGNFYIKMHSNHEQNISYQLVDITGKIIYENSENLQVGENNIQVNLNSISKGIYNLMISNSNSLITKKVIVH